MKIVDLEMCSQCGGGVGVGKWVKGSLVECLEKVTAPLFNPAGQERFGNMTRVYYKEAVGALVVFDVTRGSTFEAVSKWKHDLDSKVKLANGNPIPSVLLANKCDQKKESFNSKALMDNFCKEAGFLGWFETSAKVRGSRGGRRPPPGRRPEFSGRDNRFDVFVIFTQIEIKEAVFMKGIFTVGVGVGGGSLDGCSHGRDARGCEKCMS